MNIVKDILLVGVGGALGFGAGFIFSKKKYEKQAEDEIEEVRSYYRDKYEKDKKELDKLEENSKKLDKKIEEYVISKEEKKVKYNKISEKEKEEEMKAEAESPEEDKPTKPYLITEEEFLEGENDYEKISLTYYIFDDTLADECDEMMDVEESISSDIFNQLADADTDLYVRNPITETDFEIMRVEGSFHDRYGGY